MNSMVGISPAEAPVAYFFCPLILPISSSYPCVHCQKSAHLYVENLSPRVTEYMLTEIFAVAGPVQHVKIIPDRRIDQDSGLNYGFVEYMDMRAAETALQVLNGRKIFDTEIRVNRGYQGEQKGTHLYVENLSPQVTEYMLTEIFSVAGPVQHVKIIIPDRRIYQDSGLNYGFVEYMDIRAAETALQVLNGRKIFDTEIRVNRAYRGEQNKEDTSSHFRVFVGDLGSEVDDNILGSLFSGFGMSEAGVVWDMNGKSLGYGFVAFRYKTDAEQAIALMNGHWLGSGALRVNWADQKSQRGPSSSPTGSPMRGGTAPAPVPAPVNFLGTTSPLTPLSYEAVVEQTPQNNTTVCVGNLAPYCTQADLIPLFQTIGDLSEICIQADCGFASVKLYTHEHAAMAIVELHGQIFHGRPITCSWGKERTVLAHCQLGL